MTPLELICAVLPYFKALVAWSLRNRGLGQRTIARALNTSQALISKYLSRPREYYLTLLRDSGFSEEEVGGVVEAVTNYLIKGRAGDAMLFLTTYFLTELRNGRFCQLHRSQVRGLGECSICSYLAVRAGDEVIQRVEDAVKILESLPNIYMVVPEVGMNVVEARAGASSVHEVVGVPGRIVRVFNKVKAVSTPCYGGSRFMATLLLNVMKYFPNVRSAANIRYSKEVENILSKLNLHTLIIGPYEIRTLDGVVSLVNKALATSDKAPDAIIDLGPPGFEHLIYLFAEDSYRLVSKIALIINSLKQ